MSADGQETKSIFCNCCKAPTKHVLCATHSRRRVVEEGEQPGEITTSIWSCAGCDNETFEWKFTGIDDGEHDPTFLPPREDEGGPVRPSVRLPKLFLHLKPDLSRLYQEIIACLNENCLVLCTIGLHTLIEGVCSDKKVTGESLYQKIENLITFLPNRKLIDSLHAFRWAGNEATHENAPLTWEEAISAIEVMEDLLNFLYDLEYKASRMKYGSRMAEWKTDKGGTVQ